MALLQTYLVITLGTERIPTSFPKKRKKIGAPRRMLHHLIVVEQSFYSYICLRPFSTYANAKAIQLGDLYIVQNRSPLAPFTIYIHETSTLNKTYGIKVWCYSESLGNPLGTEKKQKNPSPAPKRPRRKMIGQSWVHVKPKIFCRHFQPRLMDGNLTYSWVCIWKAFLGYLFIFELCRWGLPPKFYGFFFSLGVYGNEPFLLVHQ